MPRAEELGGLWGTGDRLEARRKLAGVNVVAVDREELKRRSLSVVGKFRSGVTDLAEQHDKYLDEIYGESG